MKKIKIIPNNPESELILTISSAKNYIPDWYKKSPQKIVGLEKFSLIPHDPMSTTSTYKKCSPFLDALTNGYIFSLSQDIEVMLKDDGSPYIVWRGISNDVVSNHSLEQWDGLFYPENCYKHVYKWENGFTIKTPKGFSTLFSHPHNRFDLPFYSLSGVVDTDKYNLPIKFPFFLKKDFVGIIKAGTPLAQINFFKRHHWYRNIKKYKKEFTDTANLNFYSRIERSYKNSSWQKKDYD